MQITSTYETKVIGAHLTIGDLRDVIEATDDVPSSARVDIERATPHPADRNGQTVTRIKITVSDD